jgi:HEAT repeat protein
MLKRITVQTFLGRGLLGGLLLGLSLGIPGKGWSQSLEQVQRLVADLRSPRADVRLAAGATLGEFASAINTDNSQNLEARQREKRAVPEGLPAALRRSGAALAELGNDPDALVRRMAVVNVGRVFAPGESVAPLWTHAMASTDPEMERFLAFGLAAYFDRSFVIREERDIVEKLNMLEHLASDGVDLHAVLNQALRSRSETIRLAALQAFQEFLSAFEAVRFLGDSDLARNPGATLRFREKRPQFVKAIETWVDACHAILPQASAAEQLAVAEALETLARLLDQRAEKDRRADRTDRQPRGRLLKDDLGPQQEDFAKGLFAAMQRGLAVVGQAFPNAPANVRIAMLNYVEQLAVHARPALPWVRQALSDPDRFVRWSATRPLIRMKLEQPSEVAGDLATMLDREVDFDLCIIIVQTLEYFGKASQSAIPAIARALERPQPELQANALRALGAIGDGLSPALPAILTAFRSPDPKVRQLVPPLLAQMGKEALPAIDALKAALVDPDSDVRQKSSEALLIILKAS